ADGSLHAQLEYSTDLFDASTIERLIGHYRTVLAGAAGGPAQRLSELPILTMAERRRMLVDWNATGRDYDRRCIHEQFAEQAARQWCALIGTASGSTRIPTARSRWPSSQTRSPTSSTPRARPASPRAWRSSTVRWQTSSHRCASIPGSRSPTC